MAIASARTVCYVEIEAYACAVLAARMEDAQLDPAPVWTDLRTFDGGAWRGVVDLVIGGYPCQPFSLAGKRAGVDDERHLWPDVRRVVGEVAPQWVFLENVTHHVRVGLRDVRSDLESLGYRVRAGIFGAHEVGARHRRGRLFILAHARGDGRQSLWKLVTEMDAQQTQRAARGPNAARLGRAHSWQKHESHPEPAILRVADRMGDRVDRLRLTGNGVVPEQAALALKTLAIAMERDE